MKPESSLPCSTEPTTCLYSEPDQSGPIPPFHFLKSRVLLSSQIRHVLSSGLLTSGLPTDILHAPLLSAIYTHVPFLLCYFIICSLCTYNSRSQWSRGLRRRSTAARLLRSWVRIPLGGWMFVCCECCVLSGRGLCDGLITRPGESY